MGGLFVGAAVLIDREGGLRGTIVETRPDRVLCRIEDGRTLWVSTGEVHTRVHARRGGRSDDVARGLNAARAAFPTVAIASAPATDGSSQVDSWNLKWLLFSFQGRLPRRPFWIASFCAAALYGVMVCGAFWLSLMLLLETLRNGGPLFSFSPNSYLPAAVAALCFFPFCWIQLALAVKRWHDRGKSGLWILIHLVPYFGTLWAIFELGFLRGTVGPNAYGPEVTRRRRHNLQRLQQLP